MIRNLTLMVTVLWCFTASAQEVDLPRSLTTEEKAALPFYEPPYVQFDSRSFSAQVLPPGKIVRNMAEWEESQGYMITWRSYPSMLREIVRYGKEECRMYIVTTNPSSVISDLNSNGIDTTNVTFINAPSNSVWVRDYGQNTVYTNDVDSLLFVDWVYNRPRPSDDTVPMALARHLNVPVYLTTQSPNKLVATGGNWMSDGMGTAFSSDLIVHENKTGGGFGNNLTETAIDTIALKYMGINRYIKMDTLPHDGIHHIDMHMKLLDEETIMVGEYPAGIADGPQIEANLQYVLSNFKTSFGTDWRVVRIPMPSDNGAWPSGSGRYFTYTNASFINKTIIVPTYNIAADNNALKIWREACPGYKVIGINSTASIGASGALHCITHEIGVNNPLLITHQRLRDTYNTTTPYQLSATIKHRQGISNATLYYTTDTTQPYQSVNMTHITGTDVFEAAIPPQPAGTEVFYYIRATSYTNKVQQRPITAPQGFYQFKVLGTVGVNEQQVEPGVMYPNPSKGITCIPVHSNYPLPVTISCYNTLGALVEHVYQGDVKQGDNNFFIHTASYSPGVYFIRVQSAGQEWTQKLIVR